MSDARHGPVIASERRDEAESSEQEWIAAARHDPRAFAQVFVKAIERLNRYRPREGATFRGWLFAIARNTVTDRWRRYHPTHPLDLVAHTLIDRDPGPEQQAIDADDLAHLSATLDALPDKQRAIVELRLAGLTTAEIMAALNMTEPAVKSAQHRAYRRLRELMTPDQDPSR
ncbi:MAG: sigma-70 family RNA polymerase sigma factor [Chloroflexia bacterium]|nr:sigma-70 family RNA polymerase sigma factor [Chloroflexia bacterium]